jgi:hypothetical protein
VRRSRNGSEQVLATNVASYDLLPDGALIWSNGRAVFMLDEKAQSRLVLKEDLIADIAGNNAPQEVAATASW